MIIYYININDNVLNIININILMCINVCNVININVIMKMIILIILM